MKRNFILTHQRETGNTFFSSPVEEVYQAPGKMIQVRLWAALVRQPKFCLSILLLAFAFQYLYAQPNQAFDPGCQLPFQSIAVSHEIDNDCGIKGQGTQKNTAANELQNAAKNNFCASGSVQDVRVGDLVTLHKQVRANGITYGNYLSVPADRSGLQALGEGTKVLFTGYINEVKYANESSGEGVNCNKPSAESNDIHMELTARKKEPNKCKRISAEISPHFRPDDWNVMKLRDVQETGMKIRITGQLFFDASHTSCADASGSEYRASSWEIHPVYQIEVYLDGEWLDLDEIVFPHEDE